MNKSDGMQQVHFEDTPSTSEPAPDTVEKKESENPMSKNSAFIKKPVAIIATLVLVAAGVGTGYALTQLVPAGAQSRQTTTENADTAKSPEEGVEVGAAYGSPDKDTFRDEAEGVLVSGGVDGEGSHHLLRPGGPSQNVYLTSSVVDLDLFENHRITVWGETFAAQKAGWLMDVGRVEVEELNAEKPFEE